MSKQSCGVKSESEQACGNIYIQVKDKVSSE